MAEVVVSSPMNKWRGVYITLIVFGVIFIIGGVVLLYELQNKVRSDISKKIPIRNGSETYEDWLDPPVPVYMKFWVFDLVNADDFINNGAKPKLEEKGPYTYREYRPKEDVTFLENDTLVSYREPKTYVFVPEMSNGQENDTFTTVNFPLLTLATLVRFKSSLLQILMEPILHALGERLYTTYTVAEYLWGFGDPVLQKINNFTETYFHTKLVKQDTFGLFYGPTGNGSDDGVYTVYTGQHKLSNYNEIYQWQNKSSLNYWNTPYCNMINGSDGSAWHPFIKKTDTLYLFSSDICRYLIAYSVYLQEIELKVYLCSPDGSAWHPFIKKTDTLYLFSSDICRSIYVIFDKEQTVKGIPMYQFSPPTSVLEEPSGNPDNIGFCTPDCLKSGVLNISTCRGGAPVVISQPHFYQGDESFINAFEGLNPDPSKHATVLDVEPYTGAALNVAKKLQLNFYIRKLITVRETKNLQNDTVFPVVWLTESAQISSSQASEFRRKVITPVRLSVILPWAVIALGVLLLLVGLGILVYLLVSANKSKQPVKEVPDEDSDERRLLADAPPHPQYAATEEAT